MSTDRRFSMGFESIKGQWFAPLVLCGAMACTAHGAFITNGNFETASGNDFAAWTDTGSTATDAPTPISGSHSALLTQATSGKLVQDVNDPGSTLSRFTVSFDVALVQPSSGTRSFNMYLSHDPSGDKMINLAIYNSDGDAGAGDVRVYGSNWDTILTDAVTFSSSQSSLSVNHVTITGDYTDLNNPVYDVSVTDASDAVHTATGVDDFHQNRPPEAGHNSLAQVTFVTGFNEAGTWAVVDNVSVGAVPEPASLILMGLGAVCVIGRRRGERA